MKVLIPMAGSGSRFKDYYSGPKPLVPVAGKPMVQRVIENLGNKEYIFVLNKEMDDRYSISGFLKTITHNPTIVYANKTGGAACTCLLAGQHITNEPLLVANCDQVIDILPVFELEADGTIVVFDANDPKWSYARVHNNRVIEVAEKKPISKYATVGLYYFKHGLDFITGAQAMIKKDITVNGEFYVCPVYNELILMGKDIRISWIPKEAMHGMGTPEDVKLYEDFLSK